MVPRPELLLHRPKAGCRLSVVLVDWRARESFHSLHYLNRQTLPRDEYELLWLEFYRHRPRGLVEAVAKSPSVLDGWLVAGYPDECIYHKHRLYNLGLLLAQGEHVVICDSDAIFTPACLAKILAQLETSAPAVVHVDQVRNVRRDLYPFRYPDLATILGRGVRNWRGHTTAGLLPGADRIHASNYGACMAAPRRTVIAIGGADEDLGFLGYICGPYDLTFRLVNHGLTEYWLADEFLYHTWHPNASGGNAEYHAPHDGSFIALRALESRALGRVLPLVENPWVRQARLGRPPTVEQLLTALGQRDEPAWHRTHLPEAKPGVAWIERGYNGFNVFYDGRRFHGIPVGAGVFDPARRRAYRPCLTARTALRVRQLIDYYQRLPRDFWGKFWAEPVYKLPLRLAAKLGRHLANMVQR